MPPEKPPEVIVKFYENFHQVESGTGASIFFKGNYIDLEEVAHNRYEIRVTADAGTYKIGVVSEAYVLPEDGEEIRFTSSLAFDADGPAIAAALNAIGGIALGGKFEWTFVEDGTLGPILDVAAAFLGSEQRLPEAFDTEEALEGHLIWAWDEIAYTISLEKGGCASPDVKGEVRPGDTEGGSRPKRTPVSGQDA